MTAEGEPPEGSQPDAPAGEPDSGAAGQGSAGAPEPGSGAAVGAPAAAAAEEPGHESVAGGSSPHDALSRRGFMEYDRIVFFSDAVFAIAITLLAVTLHVPNASRLRHLMMVSEELSNAQRSLIGFGISFAAIGLFWLAHHSTFRYIKAFDRPLIVLNLLFLGTIAFLPYPTEILSTSSGSSQQGGVIFYASCAAVSGSLEAAIWLYATRPGSPLAYPAAAQARLRYALRGLRVPAVFLVSIPIALASPGLAEYCWLLIAVTSIAINRLVPIAEPPAPGARHPGPASGDRPFSWLSRLTRR